MEKHIHHLPDIINGLLHSVAFIAAVFKHKPKQENEYLGDNFPLFKK